MFLSIENFINSGNSLENFINYDFKSESPWDDLRREGNSIQRFHIYKKYNKGNTKFDCDNSNGTCPLTDDFFKKLWNWSYKDRYSVPPALKSKFGLNWSRFGPDTMNSFLTTYKQALTIYGNDASKAHNNIYLNRFAALTHSIGNFTLIPFKLNPEEDEKSFNQYRGANFGKYFVLDYFDLSLKIIKENVKESVFKDYIDTFLLNDYVDKDYNIKPLFKGHQEFLNSNKLSLDNPMKFLPQSEDELNEYLSNVNFNIESRSKRIISALKVNGIKNSTTNTNKNYLNRFKKFIVEKRIFTFLMTFLTIFSISFIINFFSVINQITHSASLLELIKVHGISTVLKAIFQGNFSSSMNIAFWSTPILYFLTLLIRKKLWSCPKCKKIFAMKKIKTYLIEEQHISMKMELKNKDSYGEVLGTSEQYIPGIRKLYETNYQCKFCKFEKQKYYHRDKASV